MEKGLKQLLQLSRRQNREGQSPEDDEFNLNSPSHHSHHSPQPAYPDPSGYADGSGFIDGTPGRENQQNLHSASSSVHSHSRYSSVGLQQPNSPPQSTHLPPICSANPLSSYPPPALMPGQGQRDNHQLPGFQASFGGFATMSQPNATLRAYSS